MHTRLVAAALLALTLAACPEEGARPNATPDADASPVPAKDPNATPTPTFTLTPPASPTPAK